MTPLPPHCPSTHTHTHTNMHICTNAHSTQTHTCTCTQHTNTHVHMHASTEIGGQRYVARTPPAPWARHPVSADSERYIYALYICCQVLCFVGTHGDAETRRGTDTGCRQRERARHTERQRHRDGDTHDTLRLDRDRSQYPTVGIQTHSEAHTWVTYRERHTHKGGTHR